MALSDTLWEAIWDIDRYLDDGYGKIEPRMKACRDEMNEIRIILDTPPGGTREDGENVRRVIAGQIAGKSLYYDSDA